MKKNYIKLIFCFITLNSIAQPNTYYLKYPDYATVVTKFFTRYSIKDLETSKIMKVEKKPDGWHISVIDYSDGVKKVSDELFWSKEKDNYLAIDFRETESGTAKNKTDLDKYLSDFDAKRFNICPYFGYKGWDWDVINDYENTTGLPDSILYGVGRAYSSIASNLLNDNTGYSDSTKQFKLPEGKNCMTFQQLEEFRKYEHKAIALYKQVYEMNPDYRTIVGTIAVSLSNEYVSSFLNLRIYQNEKEAMMELPDNLYDEFWIATAKNYLNICDRNAILFVGGDNDTYPLLYVQAKLGYRKDVMVVNTSLLGTSRYINSLREKVLDAPPLPITFTPEQIKDGNLDYALIDSKLKKPMDLNDAVEFLKGDDDKRMIVTGSSKAHYLPVDELKTKHGKDVIDWKLHRSYLYKSQIILLDLLAHNNFQRPIYFGTAGDNNAFIGLEDYLILDGLNYHLIPISKSQDVSLNDFVDVDAMYSNIYNKFNWWSNDTKIIAGEKGMSLNYRYNFSKLINVLIDKNKLDSSRKVLNLVAEKFPDNQVYYDNGMYYYVQAYYKLNEFEKGNQIIRTVIYNLKHNLSNYGDEYAMQESEKRALIEQFKELAKQFKQDDLVRMLDFY